ncbi:MAG: response regulator, partial [Gammaproteobacteria bacterium]|nr:response regulator [Gammaproteobacteria bacterium]
HELRTPLTTIIGNCELLADQTHNSENRQLIHSIEVAGRSQLTLVNNILDLSKIESGKFTIEALPYNLMKLLNEVEQIFTTQVKDAGIDLRIKLQSPLPFQLLGDDQRIRQILTNLIGNAIKFTQQGSVSVTIQREESLLCFRIQDSGVGIAAEDLKRLFDRFEQANSSISRRFGGSGLGLHISAQLAKQMGGSIAVESTLGEGSTFLLNLPYQESNLPTPARETSATHTRATALNEQLRGTVLVAEDTPELQLLERRILESIGVRVTIADNGKEALALATTEPFDLILMDMQMPVMDGIEATKKLRAIHNTTPIVALTANVMQKHRDAFFQAGGDDFLSKPINRTELKSILTRYLPHEEVT